MNLLLGAAETVDNGLFTREPFSSGTIAFVYKNLNNEYRVVKDGEQLTRSESRSKKYKLRYKVAMSSHNYVHKDEYPVLDFGKSIMVQLSMTVQVESPVDVVINDIKNVNDYLDTAVRHCISSITSNHYLEEYRKIQTVISRLQHETDLISDLEDKGIKVTKLLASATLSKKDEEYYRTKEEMERKKQLQEQELRHKRELEKMQKDWSNEDDEEERNQRLREEEDRRNREREDERERKENARRAIGMSVIDFILETTPDPKEARDIILSLKNDERQLQIERYNDAKTIIIKSDWDVENKVRALQSLMHGTADADHESEPVSKVTSNPEPARVEKKTWNDMKTSETVEYGEDW